MKLLELYIHGFGKFVDTHLTFSDQANVIYGDNESGKSTLHSFIKAMFYGLERSRGRASKTDLWSKYEPWHIASYGGHLLVEYKGKPYRIERDFSKNATKPLCIVDMQRGAEVASPTELLAEMLISPSAYDNTLNVSQMASKTDAGMSDESRNYIANMNTSGNQALNITKACAYLKEKRKKLKAQIASNAELEYQANMEEIRNLRQSIEDNDKNAKLDAYKIDKEQIQNKTQHLQKNATNLHIHISDLEKKLAAKGFQSAEDIDHERQELEKRFSVFQRTASHAKKKSSLITAAALLFLGMISAITGVYLYFQNKLPAGYSYALMAICFVLILISNSFFRNYLRQRRQYTKACEKLQEFIHRRYQIHNKRQVNIEDIYQILDKFKEDFNKLSSLKVAMNKNNLTLDKAKNRLTSLDRGIEEEQRRVWEMEKNMERISALEDKNLTLSRIRNANKHWEEEILAIDLALDTMTRLSTDIKDSFGLYLNKEASGYLKQLSNGAYHAMSIDNELNIRLNTGKKLVPAYQLSAATLDQVYLSLRLASAKLLTSQKENLPLFLDESFANYDKKRNQSALKFILTQEDRQVLLFTCHGADIADLQSLKVPFNLIEL